MPQAPLTATEFASAVTAITSAFGDPTRRQIYLFAREHEQGRGVTASEVAEHFELHPNVARHHLDKLSAGGYLEVAVDRNEHAGAGRPSKRYRASELVPEAQSPMTDPRVTPWIQRTMITSVGVPLAVVALVLAGLYGR